MTEDQIGNLIYLSLLGGAIAGWYLVNQRTQLNKTLQYAALWALIFIGVVAAYGLWEDLQGTIRPQQSVFAEQGLIELPRERDGHYYITLDINGAPVRFVVDTGASAMVLTKSDAARAGLHPEDLVFLGEAMTANGPVRTAPVRLDEVALGPVVDRNLRAYVNEGEMDTSLLGMEYLNRFNRLEISGGKMRLER